LGPDFENNFYFLLASGTWGDILLAARGPSISLQNPFMTNHTISAIVYDARCNQSWTISRVYGPQGDLEKKLFIRELRHLKSSVMSSWLMLGYFNLIYRPEDKNNGRLDQRLMHRFRRALNYLEVKEVELEGQKFTWSNSQASPTLTRIDRVFSSADWEQHYSNPVTQPLSSIIFDHFPLLVVPLAPP
jgi:hypothetical protein